ncbi:hypothetical protein M2145_002890 [Lachnospiraceae bacterium PF1-21]|uniref:DUF5717 family protein n=1 Tax=Ohessyouella blattaphilus TaxID=2949333 RepID=UPI003E2B0920
MKDKIQRFSKGDFRTEKPRISFDETNIVIIIGEGEVYRGSLNIKSNTNEKIRGLVYPSSLRVTLKDQGFDGVNNRVDFTYDGRGLLPGHVEKGSFTVVCDVGEYDLDFTAITEKPYINTAYGKIQSTADFKKLAIKDYSEAARLFRSKDFYEILKYENERIFYLYDNMRKWSLGEQALEEFLVGTKLKECIFLTLQGEGMLFEDVTDATKGMLTVMKNTWGFMPVKVAADGDFIRLSRDTFTTDDFVGNAYEFEFFVRPEKLHAGHNYGRLSFTTPYETLVYDVEVMQSGESDEDHRMAEIYMGQILKGYIRNVGGLENTNEWVGQSLLRMQTLRNMDPQNDMYQLLTAHISIIGKKIEEAKWILENYNYNRFALVKDFEVNCYYLYLTALIRGEGSHHARVLSDIEKTYTRHQESWLLLWMIMDLDVKFRSPTKRIHALEQHFAFDNHQVIYYLEAFLCYKEKPDLIKKLGDFELQVLNFSVKYQLVTREMALHLANFASQQKFYSEKLFRVLSRSYEIYQEPTLLNSIVTLLIRGGKVERKYNKWYKLAIDQDLKLARLYDYFMETLDETKIHGPLPRVLYLYYMHGSNLDYKKTAFLYASLVENEGESGDLYFSYREQIYAFTIRQLEQRRITESLRVLYKRFLREEELTSGQIEALRDICYAYEVKTKLNNMAYVHVIEKDGKVRQKVPYQAGGAIICLYDKEARVIWESKDGRYYTDSISYDTKRLFYEPRFLEFCKKYATTTGAWKEPVKRLELTLDNLKDNGFRPYRHKEILSFFSHKLRDEEIKEDSTILYYVLELFKEGFYDKVTLSYLGEYFVGGTSLMKRIYTALRGYELPVGQIAERIITQMVFSENLLDEEEIFLSYYASERVYFRLKQAYLALVAKEYFLAKHITKQSTFDIIMRECELGEDLADICKVALLKRYSTRSYKEDEEQVLRKVLGEMCEKNIIMPFYKEYPKSWLRQLQLYDKCIISYTAKFGGNVQVFYKIKRAQDEDLSYRKEALIPVFGNIYVKTLTLFSDEELVYYFVENTDEQVLETPKNFLRCGNEDKLAGRYARLNEMSELSPAKQMAAMVAYEEEEAIGREFYVKY